MRPIQRYLLPVLALIAMVATPAGEHSKKKCTMATQDCLDAMSNQMKKSGWVGIEFDNEDPNRYKVVSVMKDSPAEKAGMLPGDILWELEGVRLTKENGPALEKARKNWTPGQKVTYTIRRNDQPRQITLTLGAWPADVVAKYIGQHMLDHVTADMATVKAN
jgi:C-terminal processing protease CtpA/Prc